MECWTNLDENCITSEDLDRIKSSWNSEEEKDEWIGFGRQSTLAQDPNADIMRAILERLHERVNCGAATFLTKIKAHSGEPLNEEADTRAKAGRESEDETKIWNQPSDRIIFSWHTKTKGASTQAHDTGCSRNFPM